MTLIEVVAGLAILATVLSSIIAIKVRTVHASRLAGQRRAAVSAADALLSTWWQDRSAFPRAASGPVPGHADLVWQTQTLPNPTARTLGADVVRLDLFSGNHLQGGESLVSVEVVLPRRGS